MTDEEMRIYDWFVDSGIATADELNLVKDVKGGNWSEIFDAVLYVRTGYNSIEQMMEKA